MKTLLSTLLITLTLFSCAKEESPDALINQLEKIEQEEMNQYGIELDYTRNEASHSVNFSDACKENYIQWLTNIEAIQSIVNYIDVSNKLVEQFSHLEEENEAVAEIILKNGFLKQKEKFFREQLTLLNTKKEQEDNEIAYNRLVKSYGACPTNFIKDSSYIEALIDSIRDQKATTSEFRAKRLDKLNSTCEDFYQDYGIEKFSCVHRINTGEVNLDASFLGWRLCAESEKIIAQERNQETSEPREKTEIKKLENKREEISIQKLEKLEIKNLEIKREKIKID